MSLNSEPSSEPDAPPVPALQRGDHIRAGWPGSPHHDAIYLGDGRVIHMTGGHGGRKTDAHVQMGTIADFAARRPVTVRHYAGERNPDEIIRRAMSRLGHGSYHLIFNNCQHFARWCVTGDHLSEQVSAVAAVSGTVAAPAAAMSVGVNVVSSAGLVAGLSGPGIMSGLATCGAVIGGGAVAGLVVLGTIPGLASVAIMSRALREDENLPEAERAARTAGRAGSAVGLVAGSAGGIAAVSVLGVTGLSGAGISSGLAAVGAIFGGGMAAGTMCVIALPAVAAAVLGYALYQFALSQAVRPVPVADGGPPAACA